jgi:DNA-binding NarL/FixJ family response regulator
VDPDAPRRRIRVAVADDTPDMRLLLRVAMDDRPELELIGEATNGQEAIDLAAALRPDLLVLDVAMPVLDGLQALPKLAVVAPDTRVVILSALPAAEHSSLARDAGAAAYVEKTASIGVLIDELLRGANLLDSVMESLSASVHLALRRDLTSPSQARRFVAATLGNWRETKLVETIQLLVSELVTNVIVHTSGAPDVRVGLLRDHVHVEVLDASPKPARVGRPSATATSGRGLALVEALATAWGSVDIGRGKVVWFDVART